MISNDTNHMNESTTQTVTPESPVSDAAQVKALIASVEADLDYIIYKSTDPRAHEFACNAKRKIAAYRSRTTQNDTDS